VRSEVNLEALRLQDQPQDRVPRKAREKCRLLADLTSLIVQNVPKTFWVKFLLHPKLSIKQPLSLPPKSSKKTSSIKRFQLLAPLKLERVRLLAEWAAQVAMLVVEPPVLAW